MESSDVTATKDNLWKATGRNLVLFQKIELALKELVSLGSITVSGKTGKRGNPFENQSLGLVAAAFIQRHLPEVPLASPEIAQEPDEIILQSSYHISGEAAADLAERIRKAVPDRNRLAHRLLLDFDLATDSGRNAVLQWLEESHSEQSKLLDVLLDHHRILRESLQTITSFMQSEEGRSALFLPDIQGTAIIQRMLRAAKGLESSDGWLPVAEGAKGESRSEVAQTLERFEKKSLTDLMISSKLFEIRPEESVGGGRTLHFGRHLPWAIMTRATSHFRSGRRPSNTVPARRLKIRPVLPQRKLSGLDGR